MSKEHHIEMEGRVIDVSKGIFTVQVLDPECTVHARLSGKMRKHKIRVVLGDEVKVEVSPYDPTRGIISFRKR